VVSNVLLATSKNDALRMGCKRHKLSVQRRDTRRVSLVPLIAPGSFGMVAGTVSGHRHLHHLKMQMNTQPTEGRSYA